MVTKKAAAVAPARTKSKRELDLEKVEAMFYNQVAPLDWKFAIVPTPVASMQASAKREAFVSVVMSSRVDILHKDWAEAAEAARMLSDIGGIERVSIISVKPAKCSILEMYVQGNSVRNKSTP